MQLAPGCCCCWPLLVAAPATSEQGGAGLSASAAALAASDWVREANLSVPSACMVRLLHERWPAEAQPRPRSWEGNRTAQRRQLCTFHLPSDQLQTMRQLCEAMRHLHPKACHRRYHAVLPHAASSPRSAASTPLTRPPAQFDITCMHGKGKNLLIFCPAGCLSHVYHTEALSCQQHQPAGACTAPCQDRAQQAAPAAVRQLHVYNLPGWFKGRGEGWIRHGVGWGRADMAPSPPFHCHHCQQVLGCVPKRHPHPPPFPPAAAHPPVHPFSTS